MPIRVLLADDQTLIRESLRLSFTEAGYDVVALEPSERAAQHCERRLEPGSTVLRGSYRDLVATVLDGVPSRLELSSADRFDAVLLGWGSFGHVLREEERLRLLEACDVLCPDGPKEKRSGKSWIGCWPSGPKSSILRGPIRGTPSGCWKWTWFFSSSPARSTIAWGSISCA